jgi:parallel beta-helix repeat protein
MAGMRRLAIAATAVLALAGPGRAAACRTIDVAGSIQAAVARAQPCDWVLVPPGLYRESLVLATKGVHLRGLDRNTVVVDGAIDVQADGVTVENLTVHGPGSTDAIRWSGVHGWRGSYLTAYGAGPRGLVADGGDGSWDHVLARGFAGAGLACLACRVTASHVLAERNAVGVVAAGRLTLQDSLVRSNTFGIQITGAAIVRRNRIEQNERIGIDLSGASGTLVANNVVNGNGTLGIVARDGAAPLTARNRIAGNVVRGSRYDLALDGAATCLGPNRFRTSFPANVLQWTCGVGPPTVDGLESAELADLLDRLVAAKRTAKPLPPPPPQPTLPNPCRGVPGVCVAG